MQANRPQASSLELYKPSPPAQTQFSLLQAGYPAGRAGNLEIARSNLFHSFEEFSVPTGGTAFFNNAT